MKLSNRAQFTLQYGNLAIVLEKLKKKKEKKAAIDLPIKSPFLTQFHKFVLSIL